MHWKCLEWSKFDENGSINICGCFQKPSSEIWAGIRIWESISIIPRHRKIGGRTLGKFAGNHENILSTENI